MYAQDVPAHRPYNPHSPPPSASRRNPNKQQSSEEVLLDLRELVQGMKRSITDANGELKEGIALREARETITAAISLVQTIDKMTKPMTMDKTLQVFQEAVVVTLQDMGAEYEEAFLSLFQEHLSRLASENGVRLGLAA